MVSLFRADAPAYLRRIERALEDRDGEALRTAAHGLKGAIATVGSPAGRQAAADLEQAGRQKRFADARRAHRRLLERMALLEQAISAAGLAPGHAAKRPPARRPPAKKGRRS